MNPIPRLTRRVRLRLSPFFRTAHVTVSRDNLDKRICVSPEHKFILVRIPKCPNSTVLRTFVEHDASFASSADKPYSNREMKLKGYPRPSNFRVADQTRALKSFFVIVFVRNPFTRVSSAYLDKIAQNKSEKQLVPNLSDSARRDRAPGRLSRFRPRRQPIAGRRRRALAWRAGVRSCRGKHGANIGE